MEVYKKKLYLPQFLKNDGGPTDHYIAGKLSQFNQHHWKRLKPSAIYEEISRDDLMRILVSNNGLCAVTNQSGPLAFDHIYPVSAGGDHTRSNLRPVLKAVNSRKGNKIGWVPLQTDH